MHDGHVLCQPRPDPICSSTVEWGATGLSLTLRYHKNELPYLWQWRNFCDGAYVMGIEPGNADMRGRAYNRARGTLPILQPGERREYHIEVEAALGRA